MGRKEDLQKDIKWWDKHRAGKLGGYKGGYVREEDPFLHMTEEEKQRELTTASYMDLEDKAAIQNKMLSYAADDGRLEEYMDNLTKQREKTYSRLSENRMIDEMADKREEDRKNRNQAVLNAKKRYDALSPFVRLFSKSLNRVNFNSVSINEINQLYSGRKR